MTQPSTGDAHQITDRLAALLDLDPADRADAERLMRARGTGTDVDRAMAVLQSRLGSFPTRPVPDDSGEQVWICAIIRFAGHAAAWHRTHGVAESITAATLADVGRHLRLHRETHGAFGLETWWFLTLHLAGSFYQLGRLQFVLRQPGDDEPGPPGDPSWVFDVHIPPTGPLTPELVDSSFQQAVTFFRTHFPEHPARTALCFSWLLDPFLVEHLPSANISRFQERFTAYGEGIPAQADAVYFVFRTRDTADLTRLPRETSLQRLVLDRIAAGGTWQCCRGFCALS